MIGPILKRYVDAAVAALNPTPGRIIEVAPGAEVAWDQCDCNGQIWSRVIDMTPHLSSEIRGVAGPKCGVDYWIVQVALGVIRCAASMDEDGTPPSAREVSADGYQMLADMQVLQQVVLCSPDTWQVRQWTPSGPLGGCHGGEFVFTIRVNTCGCD